MTVGYPTSGIVLRLKGKRFRLAAIECGFELSECLQLLVVFDKSVVSNVSWVPSKLCCSGYFLRHFTSPC